MRIKNIKIHNYRSFKDTNINLDPYTVVVGPNNIGKSNILRAIDLFFSPSPLELRKIYGSGFFHRKKFGSEVDYKFERDFPVNLQGHSGKKVTRVILTFELEQRDFNKLSLPDKFRGYKSITVSKDMNVGRDKQVRYICYRLNESDSSEFLSWLFKTCDFIRMPSNRASGASNKLLRSFVYRIWANLRGSYKVKRSLDSLVKRAEQEIKKTEKEISNKLSLFIPELKEIKFELGGLPEVPDILDISDIKIDDGTLTSLNNKGDGVQSLFFIGLLQHMSSLRATRNLIFGIEEPELHLHPDAQEELTKTLKAISAEDQVVLTTHSPVLVNKSRLSSNIIIKKDNITSNLIALNTSSLLSIREVLGVRASHNLENAELVFLVEGQSDEKLIEAILLKLELKLKVVLDDGRLRIVHNRGASGIIDSLIHFRRELQPCIILVDDDEEGNNTYNRCLDKDILDETDIFKIPSRDNFTDTELEDIFSIEYTVEALKKSFNISISKEEFLRYQLQTGGKKKKPRKWTVVIDRILNDNGKNPRPETVNKVKDEFVKEAIAKIELGTIPKLFYSITNRIKVSFPDIK